jgi:hypothetical protein
MPGLAEEGTSMTHHCAEICRESAGIPLSDTLTLVQGDAKVITLQGTQRRFRFRCAGADEAR